MKTPFRLRHLEARPPRGLRPGKGFSIIETLVASAILLVALLAIAAVMPTADMNLHLAGQISKAASLAQAMIEMTKNDPFSQISLYHGVDTRNPATFPLDTPNPPIPGDAGNFMGGSNVDKWANDIAGYLASGAGIAGEYGTISVSTVATDATGNPILRKISVTVNWKDGGRPRRVKLESLASAI